MLTALLIIPKLPLADLFIGGLALLILLSFIVGKFKGSARGKERSAVFLSMGFVEVPCEQAFASAKEAVRIIEASAAGSIVSPVGKGSSALGETAIFEFRQLGSDAGSDLRMTVIGFRVPPSIPDFEIRHVLLGDRFFKPPAPSASGAPRMSARIEIGPSGMVPEVLGPAQNRVVFDSNPGFAKKYVVNAADEALMRRMMTPSLMDALAALNDSNLHIVKGKDWLFIYRYALRPKSPNQYPALLREAVDLVSRLDLRAASTAV